MLQPLLTKVQQVPVLIAAHRGASGDFKENTPEAFAKAIELGADIVELDIRVTQDKKIVCYHDELLGDKALSTLNYSDIVSHNVPLLDEVLANFSQRVYFVIEIKPASTAIFEELLSQLTTFVNKYDLFGKVVFAAECPQYLLRLRAEFGNTVHYAMVFSPLTGQQLGQHKLSFDCLICHVAELSGARSLLNKLQLGALIGVYGAATVADISACFKYHIRFIGTDYPGKVRQLLAAGGYTQTKEWNAKES